MAWMQRRPIVSPGLRKQILSAREVVWRGWFANNAEEFNLLVPTETLANHTHPAANQLCFNAEVTELFANHEEYPERM